MVCGISMDRKSAVSNNNNNTKIMTIVIMACKFELFCFLGFFLRISAVFGVF